MTRLSKPELNRRILDAVSEGGWAVAQLSASGEHPLRFEMESGGTRRTVRAYIWNTTHGGGSRRPEAERRIQITSGIRAFDPEPAGTTVILGWNADPQVFAAFDLNHHLDPLGRSPSIQIGAKALSDAAETGIAAHAKRRGELAIALRPDLLASYIVNIEAAHAGNLASVVAGRGEGAGEPDFDGLAASSRCDLIGSGAELAERRRVLDRLDALEREMEALRPGAAAIGHNNPPEPLEEEPAAVEREIEEATRELTKALQEQAPDPNAVARQAGRLQRVSSEARKLIDKVIEKGRDKMAEAIATVVVGAAVLMGRTALDASAAVLHQLHLWFMAIGG